MECKKFDAIFLDIAMPEFDGLNLGMWLSEKCSETYIVYVSSRNELVYRTFRTRPFSFLRKSHLDKELSDIVGDLCKQLQKDTLEDDYFEIKLDNNEIFRFHASNIFYIEVIGKNCHVVGTQGIHVTK
ncbi:Response regulator receiver domain-containing protein [Pseudobutyrivibrio sp. 49]|uniref:response regulator n=1 Tax=Pseudobutyrivibrio sp. 49 TaxID=1855344 RepID=UPI0008850764|nr:response regulator [Pseudobutyrivibrio sp. 49]SDI78902.1 Response regulator receiver domain-containing protein [Pseudobutyrivibrio sp. 49]